MAGDDHQDAAQAAARAVREALDGGGSGLRRPRRIPTPQPTTPSTAATAPPPPSSAPALAFAARPAPFVSPRGPTSPPRHTAVTISDDAPPLRFRAPPLSVDTSPGPHRNQQPPPTQPPAEPQPVQTHATSSPQGRRRAPSSGSTATAASTSATVLRHASPQSGARRTSAATPLAPPAAGVLSPGLFLRRKPPQRPPSPRLEAPGQSLEAPHVLFFQDADSDNAASMTHSQDEGSQRSTAEATDHEAASPVAALKRRGASPPARARSRASSHFPQQLAGVEKLGELSREEEAYDFAILLKPTKTEEHLERAVSTGTAGHDHDHDHNEDDPTADGEPPLTPTTVQGLAKLPAPLRRAADPASARAELVARITRTGLQVKRLLSLDGRQTLLKVRAPPDVLERGAEQMRLRKRRQFDAIWMEFACELRATFADFDAARGHVRFLDSEKQSVVHALLTGDEAAGGAGLSERCALRAKLVLKMFPLHKHDDLVALRAQWVTFWRGRGVQQAARSVLAQPVDAIAQYYGERVAYYFAWLELYTRWLVVPSVVGVVLFVLQVRARSLDHPLAAAYAIFMALWTAAFLLAWRRRAAALAYKWGTLGYEQDERARPEFRAGRTAWHRYATYALATAPLVAASLAGVLALTLWAFRTRDRLEAQSLALKAQAAHVAKDMAADLRRGLTLANWQRLAALGLDADFWFYFLLTPLLYGLLIPVLDAAFTRAARRLTDWENHATESRYQSHLILKVFSFRFVHVFASLYYYAFQGGNESGGSLLRVAVQLASFMVSDQLWRNAMQTLYPFAMRRVHARRKKKATNAQFHASAVFNHAAGGGGGGGDRRGSALRPRPRGGSAMAAGTAATSNAVIHEQCVRLEQASDHAWEEAELEPYDTFEDYTEMLIQFGYVTFFSLAFPLAPLLALLNNVFEMRVDAFKLCHAKQRPLAQKASGIGVWLRVLQLMSALAVLTNCLHIAFTTSLVERLAPGAGGATKVWVVFAVEHAILALQGWMAHVVPATPGDVQRRVHGEREHAKLESARAMAAKIQQQQLQQAQALAQAQAQQETPSAQDDMEPDTTTSAKSQDAMTTVRRRTSRGASASSSSLNGDDDGLRAAQAVLAGA